MYYAIEKHKKVLSTLVNAWLHLIGWFSLTFPNSNHVKVKSSQTWSSKSITTSKTKKNLISLFFWILFLCWGINWHWGLWIDAIPSWTLNSSRQLWVTLSTNGRVSVVVNRPTSLVSRSGWSRCTSWGLSLWWCCFWTGGGSGRARGAAWRTAPTQPGELDVNYNFGAMTSFSNMAP